MRRIVVAMDKKILFTGDFFFDYDEPRDDISKIGKWIRDNGYLTVVNLEGPLAVPAKEHAEKKRGPNLAASGTAALILEELNTAGVTLANNHMMDYGEYGLKSTLSILDDKGIKHTGAGVTLEEALKPFVIDTGTVKTAFLSFGWDVEETRYASGHSAGCAPRDKDVILREVRAAKKMYDRVVVCMHWGFEFNRYPMPYDTDLAHATIDAGADLIIGNHPHCVQPYEEYHGKTIFYSLGNFYFGSKRDMFTKVFPERITNQPDYGILVIYEPGSGMTDTRLIVYSRDEKVSGLSDDGKEEILHVLPELEEREYLKTVRRSRNNSTPVLTADEKKNAVKIKALYTVYSLKKAFRTVIPRHR